MYPNLNYQQQFRLNKINEDYSVAEMKKELLSKRLRKNISSFEYFNKSLIVLSVATGSISIVPFAIAIGARVGVTSASFSLAFSIFTGIIKNC